VSNVATFVITVVNPPIVPELLEASVVESPMVEPATIPETLEAQVAESAMVEPVMVESAMVDSVMIEPVVENQVVMQERKKIKKHSLRKLERNR
jgi:hypothetical protein